MPIYTQKPRPKKKMGKREREKRGNKERGESPKHLSYLQIDTAVYFRKAWAYPLSISSALPARTRRFATPTFSIITGNDGRSGHGDVWPSRTRGEGNFFFVLDYESGGICYLDARMYTQYTVYRPGKEASPELWSLILIYLFLSFEVAFHRLIL